MKISLPNDFTPRPYQARYMKYFDDGGTRAVWVVHRRAGKDLTALHQLCKMAHERRGLYWHMLPTFAQARRVIWQGFRNDGRRFIENVFPAAIVAGRNEQMMRIDLKCGSVVQFVGSDNYDSLVGSNPVGCVFSEFALNRPGAWNYIRPILVANGGWASFISTPRGRNGLWEMFQIAQKDPKWFCEKQTIFDTQALPASVIEEERAAGMPEALLKSEYLCDFDAALVGSIWGDLIDDLGKRGGLEAFQPDESEVFTAWDLGMSDSTAILFFTVTDTGVSFIDHLEAHGKPLSYYADEIERRGYNIVRHWLPHDANARHIGTDATVLEQLRNRFGPGKVAIGPRMALLDGIQAGRWLLQQEGTRFHPERCKDALEALRAYHYEYDEDAKTFGSKPAHDWSSHTADSFRYAAVVTRVSGLYKPRKEPAPPALIIPPAHYSFHLEQLHELESARRAWRRRI